MPANSHAVNPRLSRPCPVVQVVTTTFVTQPILPGQRTPRTGPPPMLVLVTRTTRYVPAQATKRPSALTDRGCTRGGGLR